MENTVSLLPIIDVLHTVTQVDSSTLTCYIIGVYEDTYEKIKYKIQLEQRHKGTEHSGIYHVCIELILAVLSHSQILLIYFLLHLLVMEGRRHGNCFQPMMSCGSIGGKITRGRSFTVHSIALRCQNGRRMGR